MHNIEDGLDWVLREQDNSCTVEVENVMLIDIDGGNIAPLCFGGRGDGVGNNIFLHN